MSVQRLFFGLSLGMIATTTCMAQASERIRLNQVGFPVGKPKFAVSLDTNSTALVVDANSGDSAFAIVPGAITKWNYAGKAMDTCRGLDFTAFNKPGVYRIKVGNELSHAFQISANPMQDLARASIKAFWYNRSSYALPESHAGKWARELGHPDTAVYVHGIAATETRPENTKLRSPGGWYDAGDYGKYVVNSGISTWTLLHLYESARPYFDTLPLNVPTRTAVQSDLVDEILWNLRWMLTMQDPNDGGVYNKVTTANFPGFVMPGKDKGKRWMVQKGTAATLDMAAVAAYAARLFRNDPELKTFADTCLAAAVSGWNWARANPDSVYDQDANNLNPDFVTKIYTGGYGDSYFIDEFNWAASELFLTTQVDSFATVQGLATKAFASPWTELGWPNVGTLGWLSLLSNKDLLTGSLTGIGPRLDSAINAMGVVIRDAGTKNAYRIPKGSYYWGSNAVFANNGILLWKAWQATKDTSFRDASLETLDYLLGRNPTGYCFVTGFGGKSPLHPHHRPSGADTVVAPIPGFLAGGPNGNYKNDDANIADLYPGYPTTPGPKAYLDVQTSYASNEVAINWNAPLAYLAGVWSASLPPMAVGTGIASRTTKSGARLDLATRKGLVSAQMPGHTLAHLEILGIDGRTMARTDAAAATLELKTTGHGLFLVRAVSTTGISATSRILIP